MAAFGVVTTDVMVLLAGFAASIVLCVIIIKTAPLHSHLSSDEDSGVQKIHKGVVPRIGGVGLWGGVFAAASMLYAQAHEASFLVGMIILGSLPVFAAGLVEDITKAVSPLRRLIASGLSGGIGWFLGFQIGTVEIGFIDSWLGFAPISLAVTIIVVAALANAMNMMDGLNGLSAGYAITAFAIFGVMASIYGVLDIALICFVFAAALLGFFCFNWPLGKIFLGDGGAYFLGVCLAFVAMALAAATPDITQAFTLVILAYPAWEVSHSMARRLLQKTALTAPDHDHLHARLFHYWSVTRGKSALMANSLAGIILVLTIGLMTVLATVIMTIFVLPQGTKFLIVLAECAFLTRLFTYLRKRDE